MKNGLIIFTVIFSSILMLNCSVSKGKNGKSKFHTSELKFEKEQESDSSDVEYEIIITDPGYESFLITMPAMNFYSQNYYESWNKYYVSDWNSKASDINFRGNNFDGIFTNYIDYQPNINYGLELNYKLYNYFLFVQKKYGVKFNIPRAISY